MYNMLVSKLTQCQPKPDILLKFAHAKIVMNDETKVNCFVFCFHVLECQLFIQFMWASCITLFEFISCVQSFFLFVFK